MNTRSPAPFCRTVAALVTCAILGSLPGCGTTSSVGGGSDNGTGASTDGLTSLPKWTDPNDRPTRVGWVSARASHCGFVFDPAQLRASYFLFEQSYGASQKRMNDIQRAYDYSVESTTARAKENANYCTKERVDEIRPELNRYLAGDFRPF